MKRRLDVLDGLRGLSMLLVLLNHVDSFHIIHVFPSVFQQYIAFFFLSGKLGVSFFFILSGFLMALLYSRPQKNVFIERRYARIFPPFIAIVLCMSIFRVFPQFTLFVRIAIMFFIAYIFRLLWTHVVEKYDLGSRVIKLFLIFQVLVAVWYGFFIMRMPAQWFHSLPYIIQWITTLFVNITLTLPFGDYIPMFDIVYWTLICEVLFYLLYPTVIAPIVLRIQNKSLMIKVFILLSLFPFFFGTSLLFKELRGFGIMEVEYFIYFCIGITVAIITKQKEVVKLPLWVRYLFHPLSFFILLFTAYTLSINSLGFIHLVAILFLSVPLGFVVYGLLDNSTYLSLFFSQKVWIFLGTISYSLYICSTPLIDGMRLLYKPTNMFSNIVFLLATVTVAVSVSYIMHEIIETPYFIYTPQKSREKTYKNSSRIPLLFLIIFFIISITNVYSSRFSFFSSEKKYKKEDVRVNNPIDKATKLTQKPFTFSFAAKETNLGVVLFPIINKIPSQEVGNDRILIIKIKEKNMGEWYAIQETNLAKIGNNTSLPFGFPIIANSKNKEYVLELSTRNVSELNAPSLNTDSFIISTIYQINKKELLLNPTQLFIHIVDKFQSFVDNKRTFLVALCIAPFLAIILLL